MRIFKPRVAVRLFRNLSLGLEYLYYHKNSQLRDFPDVRANNSEQKLSMKKAYHGPSKKWWHRSAVALSGGVVFFSLPGLAIELPISTIIMLRSIADIARSEDEDLRTIEAQLACLEVFALGGRKKAMTQQRLPIMLSGLR